MAHKYNSIPLYLSEHGLLSWTEANSFLRNTKCLPAEKKRPLDRFPTPGYFTRPVKTRATSAIAPGFLPIEVEVIFATWDTRPIDSCSSTRYDYLKEAASESWKRKIRRCRKGLSWRIVPRRPWHVQERHPCIQCCTILTRFATVLWILADVAYRMDCRQLFS